MKLGNLRRSRNVEDRRGGRSRVRRAGGGFGIGTILIIILAMIFPNLRSTLFSLLPQAQLSGLQGEVLPSGGGQPAPEDSHRIFAESVLGSAEDIWKEILGNQYREPRLVLFTGTERSACGPATAQTGPFYCPGDKTIYIDPAFYQVMERQLGASGDFAQAYVVAHEFAHYVQDLLGDIGRVHAKRVSFGMGSPRANQQTVRLELQADCYSGIWAKQLQDKYGALERGDLQEALNAADRIGDDALGMHDPNQYTHGTSAQRVKWFERGWNARQLSDCDTYQLSYRAL